MGSESRKQSHGLSQTSVDRTAEPQICWLVLTTCPDVYTVSEVFPLFNQQQDNDHIFLWMYKILCNGILEYCEVNVFIDVQCKCHMWTHSMCKINRGRRRNCHNSTSSIILHFTTPYSTLWSKWILPDIVFMWIIMFESMIIPVNVTFHFTYWM